MTTERPDWHTSSYSAGAQNCVEVREHGQGADVRDSQNRDGACLEFTADAWTAFIVDLRGGQL
jgi:hypothetical protein